MKHTCKLEGARTPFEYINRHGKDRASQREHLVEVPSRVRTTCFRRQTTAVQQILEGKKKRSDERTCHPKVVRAVGGNLIFDVSGQPEVHHDEPGLRVVKLEAVVESYRDEVAEVCGHL